MKNLDMTKFLIAAVGVTVFTLVYGMFIQGHIGAVDAVAITSASAIKALLVSLVITYIFTRNHEGKGTQEGVRFGILIGLLLGVVHATAGTLAIDAAVKVLITDLLFGIGSGVVLSQLLKKK